MKVHFFDKDKWSIIDSKDLYYCHDYGQEDLFCNNKKVTGYRLQSKLDKLGLWSTYSIPNNTLFYEFREKLGYTISATPPNIRGNGVHYFREDYILEVKEYINKELKMEFDSILETLDMLGFELIVKQLEYHSIIFDDGKQIVERLL